MQKWIGTVTSRKLQLKRAATEVVMYLDSDVAYINDTPITLDAPCNSL